MELNTSLRQRAFDGQISEYCELLGIAESGGFLILLLLMIPFPALIQYVGWALGVYLASFAIALVLGMIEMIMPV
jgi:hypothetical protein